MSTGKEKQQSREDNNDLPLDWYSNVTINKPLSLIRYNHAMACKMHTCLSGKLHNQIHHKDSGHTVGNKHAGDLG